MRTELSSLEQKLRREPGLSGRALPHPVPPCPTLWPRPPCQAPPLSPSSRGLWTSHHSSHRSSARRPLSCTCFLACTL